MAGRCTTFRRSGKGIVDGLQHRGLRLLLALPLLALPLLFGSCTTTDTNTVRIYSSLPLQGPTAPEYQSVVDAIRMALAGHTNGGAGGLKVEYISLDDSTAKGKWDADREQSNARRAAADPAAAAYIGPINSGAAKVSIPILNRVQLAMVSPANTYPGLTKTTAALAGEPYVYSPLGPDQRNYCRVVTTDDIQGTAAAVYAQQQLGAKSVYVLDDTELYGHGIAAIFAAKAKDLGVQVAGTEGIDTRAANYTDLAKKLVAGHPDLVYFGGITENHAPRLLQDLRAAGFQGTFMGPDGIVEQAFIDAVGVDPGKVVATLVGLPAGQLGLVAPAGAAWYAQYKRQHSNREPGPYAQYGYVAMNALLDALDRAGQAKSAPDRRLAVLGALRAERNVQSIIGAWGFDANCDTTLKTISFNEVQGKQFVYKGQVTP